MWRALGCSALLLTFGCTSCAPWPGLVKVGLVAPFEGQHTALGHETLRGVRLAIDERNQQGGVHGRRVELVALDDQDAPEMANRQARELIADPLVIGVVGHLGSDSALAALGEYRRAGMLLLSPATADGLAGPGFFRLGASDTQMAGRVADFAQAKLLVSRVVLVAGTSPGHQALAAALERALEARGLLIVEHEAADPRQEDFGPLVNRAQRAGGQVFIAVAGAETTAALAGAVQEQRLPLIVLGHGPTFARLAGPSAIGAYWASPLEPGEADASFRAAFQAKYGSANQPTSLARAGYLAMNVLLQAAARAGQQGTPSRGAVLKELENGWSGRASVWRPGAAGQEVQGSIYRLGQGQTSGELVY